MIKKRIAIIVLLITCLVLLNVFVYAGNYDSVSWVEYEKSDPLGDTEQGALDIVGDETNSAVYISSDNTMLSFRMRVDSDPSKNGGFDQKAWYVLINTDNDTTDNEYKFIIDGTKEKVDLMHNGVNDAIWSESTDSYAEIEQTNSSSFGDDDDYFISFHIPLSDFKFLTGLNDDSSINYKFGTATNTNVENKDSIDNWGPYYKLSGTVINSAPVLRGTNTYTVEENTVIDGLIEATDDDDDDVTFSNDPNNLPSHGVLDVTSDSGVYKYTPTTDYVGDDSFKILGDDGQGNTASITIDVTLTDNVAPVLSGTTTYTLKKNTVIDGLITAVDDDDDDVTFSTDPDNLPSHGILVVTSDSGVYKYTPTPDYVGDDSFKILGDDGHGNTVAITINVTLTDNVAPVLSGTTTYTLKKNTVIDATITATDDDVTFSTDPDNLPSHGILVVTSDSGVYKYTPTTDYVGDDSFKILGDDGHNNIVTITINVTLTDNLAPVLSGTTTYTVEENTIIYGLVIATDAEDDGVTFREDPDNLPSNGILLVILDSGVYQYTPTSNYVGDDSFKIIGEDSQGNTASITIEVTLTDNVAPVLNGTRTYTVEENTVIDGLIAATDNDGDDVTFRADLDNLPSHGVLVVTSNTGDYKYTPIIDYVGDDSFKIIGEDSKGNAASITVNVTLTDNVAPVLSGTTTFNVEVNSLIDGLISASDIDGDDVTFRADPANLPNLGILVVTSDSGVYVYTPTSDYAGDDSFIILGDDNKGNTASITINVTMNINIVENNVPYFISLTDIIVSMNDSKSGEFAALDDDADDIEFIIINEPENGLIILDSFDGSYTYKPNHDYYGQDSFVVGIRDGKGGLSTDTINITVERDYFTLNGTVVGKELNETISNTDVKLFDLSGQLIAKTETDKDGKYSFENVVANGYSVEIDHKEYSEMSKKVLIERDSPSLVTLDFFLVNFKIKVYADPSTIVGDGNSETTIFARLLDADGVPLSNISVDFSATLGSFPEGTRGTTDKDGLAQVVFRSSKILGLDYISIPTIISVDVPEKNLSGEEMLIITFGPSSVAGTVIGNNKRQPVNGALVEISKDFDSDGVTDFYAQSSTGSDGTYTIAVPKGDLVYDVDITVTENINGSNVKTKYRQKSVVGTITGVGNEIFYSKEAIAGIITKEESSGYEQVVTDFEDMTMVARTSDGLIDNSVNIEIYNDGTFYAENLSKNETYTIDLNYSIAKEEMSIGSLEVAVLENGEVQIGKILIDPYGDVTDSKTGQLIHGANVILYYADTQRNKDNGVIPHTLVDLPVLDNFPPANNVNPHLTSIEGKYAYMVFPETDYYLIAQKDKYDEYTSPTIPVEFEIVRHDISMNKTVTYSQVSSKSKKNKGLKYLETKIITDVLEFTVNSTIIKPNQEFDLTFKITNNNSNKDDLNLVATISSDFTIVNANGGVVNGDTITWNETNVSKGEDLYKTIRLIVKPLDQVAKVVKVSFEVSGNNDIKIITEELLITKDGDGIKHNRFIYGYPDQSLKLENHTSYGEISAMLYSALGIESKTNESNETNNWATPYSKELYSRGFEVLNPLEIKYDEKITYRDLFNLSEKFIKSMDIDSNIDMLSDLLLSDTNYSLDQLAKDMLSKPEVFISRKDTIAIINDLRFKMSISLLQKFNEAKSHSLNNLDMLDQAIRNSKVSVRDDKKITVESLDE